MGCEGDVAVTEGVDVPSWNYFSRPRIKVSRLIVKTQLSSATYAVNAITERSVHRVAVSVESGVAGYDAVTSIVGFGREFPSLFRVSLSGLGAENLLGAVPQNGCLKAIGSVAWFAPFVTAPPGHQGDLGSVPGYTALQGTPDSAATSDRTKTGIVPGLKQVGVSLKLLGGQGPVLSELLVNKFCEERQSTLQASEINLSITKPQERFLKLGDQTAQLEAQRATQDFQRAIEVLRAAKETISLAEQRLLEEDSRQFDSAWQEMLNHATQRVMEAEQTKARSELVHRETAAKYNAAIGHMKQLEKKLKRTINKSRAVFLVLMQTRCGLGLCAVEEMTNLSGSLDFAPLWELRECDSSQLKKRVDERQAKLTSAKGEYRTALRNLEMISDEIHERRRSSAMGPRGQGVGAEGDSITGDDITNFKMESDGISMVSVTFEDENCNSGGSEEESETRSLCSAGSGPETQSTCSEGSRPPAVPLDLPCPCASPSPGPDPGPSSGSGPDPSSSVSSPSPSPSSSPSPSPSPSPRPSSLDLPGPVSLCTFGLLSPVLGPRSECSGASSPESDLERGNVCVCMYLGDRAEGAEGKQDDAGNRVTKKRTNLERRFGQLSLERTTESPCSLSSCAIGQRRVSELDTPTPQPAPAEPLKMEGGGGAGGGRGGALVTPLHTLSKVTPPIIPQIHPTRHSPLLQAQGSWASLLPG
ncbi:hypothetical protein JZ751_000544 [Albula glossodonta]|uniref:SH3 domain-binding protein 5 n=1 Tax=Albula glossodonta TaxID=121402 RepID=A0A8T2PWW1_9TELE|nr:hypothetical protein JZ751_000544 [Albula glossodonta]